MRIDAHCDTADWLNTVKSLRNLYESHNDYSRMYDYLDIAFCAIFFNPHKFWYQLPEKALVLGERLICDIEKNRDLVELLQWQDQLEDKKSQTKLILALEGGELLGNEGELLPLWYRLGLRSLGLTWNYRNQLGDGCFENGGLSRLGKKIVTECNKLGIIVDGAHLSEVGFWDLSKINTRPFIISHGACFELLPHPRNLKDQQLRELKEQRSVIGITFVKDFLRKDNACVEDVVRHILHVIEIAGIDCVGIGSDFDGAQLCDCLTGSQDLPLLWQKLALAGLDDQSLHQIMGGNFLRVLKENLPGR